MTAAQIAGSSVESPPRATLILLRHGESEWNRQNRFTGWTDIDLSPAGVEEARGAAQMLLAREIRFDIVLTSVLTRAIRTAWLVADALDVMWLPLVRCWRLNERHYGALQGLDKTETERRFGHEQVQTWRRSFGARPPALSSDDERHPRFDRRYAGIAPSALPCTESLEDTLRRVMPCWRESIRPHLIAGHNVLVVAHGNSLRALIKHLQQLSDDQVASLEIPTGRPWLFGLDDHLRVTSHEVLTAGSWFGAGK